MMFEWDAAKDAANFAKHKLHFADAANVFTHEAATFASSHRHHGELRWLTIGPIRGRVFVVVWTQRGENLRLISARKANAREIRRYKQARAQGRQNGEAQ